VPESSNDGVPLAVEIAADANGVQSIASCQQLNFVQAEMRLY
jgi:hypothetical protein